jgi:hypothetical protein
MHPSIQHPSTLLIGWARTACITHREKNRHPTVYCITIYGRKSPNASLFMTHKTFPKKFSALGAWCTQHVAHPTPEILAHHSSCLHNFCKVDRYFFVMNFGCECRCGACCCSDQVQRATCTSLCQVWLSIPGRQ